MSDVRAWLDEWRRVNDEIVAAIEADAITMKDVARWEKSGYVTFRTLNLLVLLSDKSGDAK